MHIVVINTSWISIAMLDIFNLMTLLLTTYAMQYTMSTDWTGLCNKV